MNDLKAIHKTIIICTFLVMIPMLQISGQDIAVFVTVGMAILAGLGIVIGTTQSVQKQTNGRETKFIEVIEAQNKQMSELASLIATLPPSNEKPEIGMTHTHTYK